MMELLAIGVLTFALAASAVPLIRAATFPRRWLFANPVPDRWHRRSVSKVGGLAMLFALTPLAFITLSWELRALALLSVLMFGVGFVDDVRRIGPTTKLAAQSLSALVFLMVAPPIRLTGVTSLDLALAFVWLVTITNAFNLLDNIDGLAAAVAAIVTVFVLAMLVAGSGARELTWGLAALAGAVAGFLLYNWHPASVFMGDSGSHFIGAFIAGATLLSASSPDAHAGTSVAFGLLLLVPMADLLLVSVTRRLAGRNPMQGGIDHASHRLVALGLSERRAVIVLCLVTIAGGAIAMAIPWLPAAITWTLAGAYATALVAGAVYLGRVRIARRPDAARRSARKSARVRPRASIAASSRSRVRQPNPVL